MKVAIVGAGISGLYLGWKLSNLGNDVTIFEKNFEVGHKVCSGIISEKVFNFLNLDDSIIENTINSVYINFLNKVSIVNFKNKVFIVNRKDIDSILYNRAVNLRTNFIFGKEINTIPNNFDRVVGCDGYNSIIRKELKLVQPKMRQVIRGIYAKTDYDNYAEVWVHSSNGFIWKVPRGKTIEYGIIGDGDVRSILSIFLLDRHVNIASFDFAIIPQGCSLSNNKTITLCGDSIGLTKPWSGGGIAWSLIAADILVNSFPNFLEYKRILYDKFRIRIAIYKAITNVVYKFGGMLPNYNNIGFDFLSS